MMSFFIFLFRPNANGVTFGPASGNCYAELGQTGTDSNTYYQNCLLAEVEEPTDPTHGIIHPPYNGYCGWSTYVTGSSYSSGSVASPVGLDNLYPINIDCVWEIGVSC